MDYFIYGLLFWCGSIVGFILSWWLLGRLKSYGGVILAVPDKTEDKVIYSLVLFDNPDNLQFEKEVLFRVDTSVENGDRE